MAITDNSKGAPVAVVDDRGNSGEKLEFGKTGQQDDSSGEELHTVEDRKSVV